MSERRARVRRPNADDLLQQEGEFSAYPDTPSPYQDTSCSSSLTYVSSISSFTDISSISSYDSDFSSWASLDAFKLELVRKERTPTQTG